MSEYNVNMFEQIKKALDNQKSNGGNYKDFLKLEAGNSYIVRLLPNLENIDNTFFHYFSFGWESFATGQYVSAVSPITVGDRCPINEYRFKMYRAGDNDPTKLDIAKKIKRSENWLINVYVVDDPANPDNNGTIKVLRYGKQLDKIFQEAISGEDSDEFGPAVFDLSENGCNLRIKVEKNEGGFNQYTSSRFLAPKAINGMTPAKMKEVYDTTFDLTTIHEIKSYNDLVDMIHNHLKADDSMEPSTSKSFEVPSEEEEELPYDFEDKEVEKDEAPAEKKASTKKSSTKKATAKKAAAKKEEVDEEVEDDLPDNIDDEISQLLEGLE